MNYEAFYQFYLSQHQKPWTRTLHVIGTFIGMAWAVYCIFRAQYPWIPLGFIPAYGLAWISHFFIEKNRPATFRYPVYSFISDFRFIFEVAMGKRRIWNKE